MVTQFTVIADTSRPLTSHSTVLATIIVVGWSLMFALLNVSIQQLLVKGFKHLKLWHVLSFSVIIATVCWGGYLGSILPPNKTAVAPILGSILVFVFTSLPMMLIKHQLWIEKICFRIMFPLIYACVAFALIGTSLELVGLPLNKLLREIVVFFWFFFGCFLCSTVFSMWKLGMRLIAKICGESH